MKTKNLPLIIGISLPIIFIIIIACVLFLPSLSMRPEHDFIYSTSIHYNDQRTVSIVQDKLVMKPDSTVGPKLEPKTFYRYDVTNDSSHKISLEEAQSFLLDAGPSSPDGYIVKHEYSHDGIFELFGSNGRNSGYYTEKGNAKKRLVAIDSISYFEFIGWIK